MSEKKRNAMKFLFNYLKQKSKYHHWDGRDTACRLWSTGGIKQDRPGWGATDVQPTRELCHMCRRAVKGTP
jgi:hypothetical protein